MFFQLVSMLALGLRASFFKSVELAVSEMRELIIGAYTAICDGKFDLAYHA